MSIFFLKKKNIWLKSCKFQGGGCYSPKILAVFLMVASFYTDIIET